MTDLIVITGSSGALGQSIVDTFSSRSDTKLFCIDRAKVHFTNEHQNITEIKADLSSYDSTANAISQIAFGDFEYCSVLNLAGFIYNEPIVSIREGIFVPHSEQGWRQTLESNLDTAFNSSVHFANALMSARRKGVIINISSITADGNPGQIAYATAKSALIGLSNTIGKELGKFGIRGVSLSLGYIETSSTIQALGEEKIRNQKRTNPMKRIGYSKEVTNTIDFIISNKFCNATNIKIDGGERI